MLGGKPAAGPAQSGLDLVEDQERTALLTQSTYEFEKFALGRDNTAFSLDDFEDHGRGRGVDRRVHRAQIVEWNV